MLITSSNDAAVAIAKYVGAVMKGKDEYPRQAFIRLMNERARELGMTRTEFFDESGLDVSASQAGAYGSALDIARLLAFIVKKKPELIEATIRPYDTFTSLSGVTHAARNTNEAIPAIPSLIGGKTGYTDLAGGNLAIVFDRSINEPVVVIVLGSSKESRFSDIKTLVEALAQ
jgi:D-alanyl-D-alanine carboxypeptidase (penicillin-binding protein 5/6)